MSKTNKTYYEILGVTNKATPEEIKKSYRTLAKSLHPDNQKGDKVSEERFKEVAMAYEVLSNPVKKTEYDSGLSSSNYRSSQNTKTDSSFDDFFNSFYKGSQPSKKEFTTSLLLSFKEAIYGAQKVLSIPREYGKGKINLSIPAGVSDGSLLRFEQNINGAASEVYVTIYIEPHPLFKRDELDVSVQIPISFTEATIGCNLEIYTVYGESVKIKIKSGTQTGSTLRLKGRGVKTAKSLGDMYVTLIIVVPEELSFKSEKLIRKLHDELDFYPRADLRDFSQL
jgi:molecular chaperone DnaJ